MLLKKFNTQLLITKNFYKLIFQLLFTAIKSFCWLISWREQGALYVYLFIDSFQIEVGIENNVLDDIEKDLIFEAKTLFGNRDNDLYEVIGRGAMEIFNDEQFIVKEVQAKYQKIPGKINNIFGKKNVLLFIALDKK